MDDTKNRGVGGHPLMQVLLSKIDGPREYSATYRLFRGAAGEETPDSITTFLALEVADPSTIAREALEALESWCHRGDDWDGFKWKLTAFTHVQDVFDCPLYDSMARDPLLLFQQYYFYYESLRVLRESLLCGLNGFGTAATALLGPFLEFTLLQNYFYRTMSEQRTFGELVQYFKTGLAPKTSTLIKRGLPKDEFAKPIRFRLNSHLSGLSESTLHPYHPCHSAAHHQPVPKSHSFESLHFWYTTRLVLEAALWVYFVNFPMLFVPVDVVRKFGCNGPVGVFVDEYAGLCVRKSVPEEDYRAFSTFAREQEDTTARLAYYSSFPDLSGAEIEASWRSDEGEPYPGMWPAYAQTMARMRASRGIMALRRTPVQSISDAPLRLRTLSGWREMSTRHGG